MESELLRLVDSIHRDKSIDKEIIFESIQESLESAIRRKFKDAEVQVSVDRQSGIISAVIDGQVMDPKSLGRIAAHGTRLNFSNMIKSAESDVVYKEFVAKKNSMVMGTVFRKEDSFIIVNLGKTEGILPIKEQVYNERYKIGERIRVLVLGVEKKGQQVSIKLSRSHPDFVRNLFTTEVPEIADRTIEIKGIARDAGRRTKIALYSNDERVDCVGSCVGVRGSRIKGIINEMNNEKIDIVKWDSHLEIYIVNVMSPATVSQIELDKANMRARVVVPDEQYSLAIGKKGQNIRLASQLTKCHLDVITSSALMKENMIEKLQFQKIPYLTEQEKDSMIISGVETIEEIYERNIEGLTKFNFIDHEKAVNIMGFCRQVIDGEISIITPEDIEAIEKKIRSQTSKELIFNLPIDEVGKNEKDE